MPDARPVSQFHWKYLDYETNKLYGTDDPRLCNLDFISIWNGQLSVTVGSMNERWKLESLESVGGWLHGD